MKTNATIWIVVIVLIGGGIVVWDKYQQTNECKDRALIAATDSYTASDYPNTGERGQLQEQYKIRYINQSC